MFNILFAPREKIIHTYNFITLFQQFFAKMGSDKSGAAGHYDHGARYSRMGQCLRASRTTAIIGKPLHRKPNAMQSRNRLLDDLAKVAGSAAGVAAGLKNEVEARLRHQFERVLEGLELVDRDEFEPVRAMAAEARAENERLAARIADLEAAAKSGNTARKTTRKSAKKSS